MSVAPDAARVLAVTRVVPVPPPPAGSLAGRHHENLSFLDAPWVATPPVQQVFLYELAGGHEFPALVRRLKESLAATLALYLPLAGKLAYAAETGDVVIDCSDAGVDFFEAEAEGDVTNAPAFVTLLPEHDARVLPAPVMRVQATLVGVRGDSGAGLALGVSLHHAIADGHGMALFMGSWASACRGGSPVLTSLGPPEHSRVAVAHVHPDGEALARQVLKKVAPDLPVVSTYLITDRRQCYLYVYGDVIMSASWCQYCANETAGHRGRGLPEPPLPAGRPDVQPRRRPRPFAEAPHRRPRVAIGGHGHVE